MVTLDHRLIVLLVATLRRMNTNLTNHTEHNIYDHFSFRTLACLSHVPRCSLALPLCLEQFLRPLDKCLECTLTML